MNTLENYVCLNGSKPYVKTSNFKEEDQDYFCDLPIEITKDKWAFLKLNDNLQVEIDQVAYDAYQAVLAQQALDKIESDKEELELYKMELGKRVLALIGVIFDSLTQEDYELMLTDQNFLLIQNLLRQGAIKTSRKMIFDTPTNSYLTQTVKDRLLAKLDSFIATLP